MSWRDLQALVEDPGPACMGYQSCCVCARCLDRFLRSEILHRQGRPSAAADAERESADYFEAPWRFDKQVPPRPLKTGG